MTKDYFGIHYEDESSSVEAPASKSVPDRSEKLSGTEYLDAAFFPGLNDKKLEESSRRDRNIGDDDGNYFDSQFFGSGARSNRDPLERVREQIHDHQSSATISRKDHRREQIVQELDETGYVNKRNQAPETLERLRSELPRFPMDQEPLIEFLSNRLIFADDNVIVFDKPFGLPYSGAPAGQPSFDRTIQEVKARVAPRCERLHLVRSLDKDVSGLLIFATSKGVQDELKGLDEEGRLPIHYRCIVKGELCESPLRITIPLIKTIGKGTGKTIKMVPALNPSTKADVLHARTECKTMHSKRHVSLLDVTTFREVPHQVRAHLSLAGHPLIGDRLYSSSSPKAPGLPNQILDRLGLNKNQAQKIGMSMHRGCVELPSLGRQPAHKVIAPLPPHFAFLIQKLRLFKK